MTDDRSQMRDGDMPLLDRIESAMRRVTSGQGQMRVPVEATDPDVVLADCKREIERLRGALADGPTPGPWESFPVGHGSQCVTRVNNREVVPPDACELAHAIVDARYIAAACKEEGK